MSSYPIDIIRNQFPALARQEAGECLLHADAPGGIQVPIAVMDRMRELFMTGTANHHGLFHTSREADAVMDQARARAALFMGTTRAHTIHFGANMTSLCFHLADAVASTWKAGDAIVVTDLDHDANVQPWRRAAARVGVDVRVWPFSVESGRLELDDLEPLLADGTVRLIAATAASNALGSLLSVSELCARARFHGALTHIDAVHLAPHRSVEVEVWGCDFCTISAYKFGGPHLGIQYVSEPHAHTLAVAKVRPATDTGAARWETGTQSLEALAGFNGICDYYCGLVQGSADKQTDYMRVWQMIASYEADLARQFLDGCATQSALTVHGPAEEGMRTPTFAITSKLLSAEAMSAALGERGIASWHGHFYAISVPGRFQADAFLRIGFAHYHRPQDVQRVLAALDEMHTTG